MQKVLSACLLFSFTLSLTNSLLWAGSNLKRDGSDHEHNQYASIGDKRCSPPLGCFVITPDFSHPLYRPINFLPHDRKVIDTRFLLYTKEHPKEWHDLTVDEPQEITDSPFDPTHPTVFIVHGFFDSRFYGKWMELTKDNLLLHGAANVFIVDWSRGNGAPYTQAAANARLVGAEIALMIQTLQEMKGISPMDCHIIGHSLGAHVAAYAGERLQKLGRITGLDPAQPYFQNMPPSVRLDQTDADFVDIIHTDSASYKFLALGMSQAIGHVDFYPNNGMSQPGCTHAAIHSILLEGLVDAARRFVSCNHQRAVDFFAFSINYKKALPVAYQCNKWEDYLEGQCASCGKDGKKCAVMGFRADQYKSHKNDSQSVTMYLATSGSAPFWEYTYQITIRLKKPNVNYQDRSGNINIKLQGTKSNYDITLSHKTNDLIHGAAYSFLIRKQDMLGDIKGVTFSWISSSWSIFTTHTIYLEYVEITPMNTNDEKAQKQSTKRFCSKIGQPIKSKNEVILAKCKNVF